MAAIAGWLPLYLQLATAVAPAHVHHHQIAMPRKFPSKNRGAMVVEMRDKGRNRGPLWRGRPLSIEAIHAVRALKKEHHRRQQQSQQDPAQACSAMLSRLLKKDLISVLQELQRQDLCDLLFPIFEAIRKESWYKADVGIYAGLIETFGRNKLMDKVEACLLEMQREGLPPDAKVCTATIGAFLDNGMVESSMETYELMKRSECYPDKSTFTLLIDGLQKCKRPDLAEAVLKESEKYLVEPLDDVIQKLSSTSELLNDIKNRITNCSNDMIEYVDGVVCIWFRCKVKVPVLKLLCTLRILSLNQLFLSNRNEGQGNLANCGFM